MALKSDIRAKNTWAECPSCGGTSIIQDHQRGSFVCRSCGYVIEEGVLDAGPEWRAYSQEQREKRSRGGVPTTYTTHDKGLSTMIDWKNVDAQGRKLSSKRRSQMYRLRKWQRRTRISNSMERNLAIALTEMDRMASQLGLPKNVREEASLVYRRAAKGGTARGRSIEGVVAAVLYATCRELGIPRTIKEISRVSGVNKRKISRTRRALSRKLGTPLSLADPVNYATSLGGKLGLSNKTLREAVEIVKKAKKRHLTVGYNPSGVAAGAIYIATRINEEKMPQKEIAKVAGTTEVTVRSRYAELCRKLDIELPGSRRSGPAAPSEKRKKGSAIKAKDTKIQNVVVSATWDNTALDLGRLSEILENTEYHPEKFAGLVYKPSDSSVAFLIFSSGKANCVGGRNVKEAEEAIGELTEGIRSGGVSIDSNPETVVQNIVVKAEFDAEVNLDRLHESGATTEYNPETFPGLTLRIDEGHGCALVFQSGQVVFHVQREEDIEKVTSKVADVLEEVVM